MGWKVREGLVQMKQLGMSVWAFKYQCAVDDCVQGLGVHVLI